MAKALLEVKHIFLYLNCMLGFCVVFFFFPFPNTQPEIAKQRSLAQVCDSKALKGIWIED